MHRAQLDTAVFIEAMDRGFAPCVEVNPTPASVQPIRPSIHRADPRLPQARPFKSVESEDVRGRFDVSESHTDGWAASGYQHH